MSEERSLGFLLKLQLRAHMMMCESCRTFKASLKLISDLHQASFTKFSKENVKEIEDSKASIKNRVKK